MVISVLPLFFSLSPAGFGAGAHDHVDQDDECKPVKCGPKGPEIRFPFWLKDHQPERCGYGPGYALTCSPTNETLVDIPFCGKGVVTDINYLFQNITYEFSSCLPHQNILQFNTSPFLRPYYYYYNGIYNILCEYYVFSCSTPIPYDPYDPKYALLPCLSPSGHNLYLMASDYIRRYLFNCTKMYTIPSVPCIDIEFLPDGHTARWYGPFGCYECEET